MKKRKLLWVAVIAAIVLADGWVMLHNNAAARCFQSAPDAVDSIVLDLVVTVPGVRSDSAQSVALDSASCAPFLEMMGRANYFPRLEQKRIAEPTEIRFVIWFRDGSHSAGSFCPDDDAIVLNEKTYRIFGESPYQAVCSAYFA